MIIYQISLPKEKNTKTFVKFMNEEYFPAVHKGPTRIGQVTGLLLLEGENGFEGDDLVHEFFLHVGWSGMPGGNARVDDQEVLRKLEKFKADIKRIGSFNEVADWREDNIA